MIHQILPCLGAEIVISLWTSQLFSFFLDFKSTKASFQSYWPKSVMLFILLNKFISAEFYFYNTKSQQELPPGLCCMTRILQ